VDQQSDSRRTNVSKDPDPVTVLEAGLDQLAGIAAVRDSAFIAVVTLTAGKIVRYRDYWNPTGRRPVPAEDAA
jgi:ketosteroid isomerase-like protein